MAIISGHCLNSVFGTNAAGLSLRLSRLGAGEPGAPLFETISGPDGRFRQEVVASDPGATYELVYETGAHLAADAVASLGRSVLPQSVMRFQMPDPHAHYHFSMAFTPGSFTALVVVLKA